MKELARGIKINVIANFLRFSRLGFTLLAALLYGTDMFGIYTVVWASTEILIYFGRLGLNQGLLFELSHFHKSGQNDELYTKIGTSLKALFLVSLIEAFLFVFYARTYVDVDDIRHSIYLIAPCIPFYAVGILLLNATMGLKEMRYNALIRSGAEPAALLLFVVIFWKTPLKHFGIVLAQCASLMTTFFLSLWAYNKHFSWKKTFKALPGKIEYRKLVRYSLPMYLMGLMDTALYRSDIFLISFFLGAGNVTQQKLIGVYGFAKQIARVLTKTKTAFGTILLPVTSEAYLTQEMDNLWSQIRYATEKILLLNIPLALFLAAFGPYILELFGKDAALLANAQIYWLVAGQFALSTFSVFMFFLVSTSKSGRFLTYEILIIIVSVLAGILMVKQHGSLGATLAISFGYIIIALTAIIEMFRVHPKDFLSHRLSQLLISGIMISFGTFLLKEYIPHSWNPKIATLGILAIAMPLFFAINADRKQWKNILKW